MGIERIEIEGFRSLKHVVWEPSNLNVLIGPNGSGKSNVLTALQVLSASADGRLRSVVDELDGIKLMAWGHTARELTWWVKLGAAVRPSGRSTKYRVTLSNRPGEVEYTVSDEELFSWKGKFVNDKVNPLIVRHFQQAEMFDDSGASRKPMNVDPCETLLSGQAAFANSEARQLRDILSAWKCHQYMPVTREAAIRRSVKSRREEQVQSDGQNLTCVIHSLYQQDESLTTSVNDAMRAALGHDFDKLVTPPAENTRVQLTLKWTSLQEPLSALELSDGILRFLLLVTILSQPNPPPLIAIDEPETGLHPSMLPIIAEYAVEASEKTQVILTTHSPEFLSCFRDVVPKVTIAMWEDGQTVLKTPPKDRLDYWLKEYSLGNLMSSGQLEDMVK